MKTTADKDGLHVVLRWHDKEGWHEVRVEDVPGRACPPNIVPMPPGSPLRKDARLALAYLMRAE